jgi:hypothetical protein
MQKTALDIHGAEWEVREAKPTAHGFAVLLGVPAGTKGKRGAGVILTPELRDFLAIPRLDAPDLPMREPTVRKLRKLAGIPPPAETWWSEREADLRAMTPSDFSRAHGCSINAAWKRKNKLADPGQPVYS